MKQGCFSELTLAVLLVLLACLLCAWADQRITGYHIRSTHGRNCVVAEILNGPDIDLYCSPDIERVEDALKRYRSMPLGREGYTK